MQTDLELPSIIGDRYMSEKKKTFTSLVIVKAPLVI